VNEIERFESSEGNIITLTTDGSRWEVSNHTAANELVWTETSVSGSHPFTEEEARAEFERWRV
jgi:frataxin-like iron-binding protein CyaY